MCGCGVWFVCAYLVCVCVVCVCVPMASQEVERVNKHYGRIEEKISKMIKQTKSALPALR